MSGTDCKNYSRAVMDSIKEPVIVIDRDLKVHCMNRAAKRIACVEGDTFPDTWCYNLYHGRVLPCDAYGEPCPVKEVFRTGRETRTERLLFSGREHEGFYEVSATPVLNEGGKVEAVAEVLRDVTAVARLRDADQTLQSMNAELKRLQDLFGIIERAKKEWEITMDCVQDMVILVDEADRIRRCNIPFTTLARRFFDGILGRDWRELLLEIGLEEGEAGAGRGVERVLRPSGRVFLQHVYQVDDEGVRGAIITLNDITLIKRTSAELETKNLALEKAYRDLQESEAQLLHQEKMASIGLLAAGVAHEINNPVGFVSSNLGTLNRYVEKLSQFMERQSAVISEYADQETAGEIEEERKRLKIGFLVEDARDLIKESLDGVGRVRDIVLNLKNFSRIDQDTRSMADINECLESTLKIVWNELKYNSEVIKEFGELSPTFCSPQELNQVFVNLLVNAAQAIDKQGKITIRTWEADNIIHVSVSDTGCGIKEKNLHRLFEPFFTTKDVGKGTGLGLSIVYDIVTKKHNGEITVESEEGKGTTFTVKIPVVEEDS